MYFAGYYSYSPLSQCSTPKDSINLNISIELQSRISATNMNKIFK